MKGLPDYGYPAPGEPIAIRVAGVSGDGRVCGLNFLDIGALDNSMDKNKCSALSKNERYGTSHIFGKQKTNRERRRLLGKLTLVFEKTKTKQMQRCNPSWFKTYRRTKGSGNHVIPYFEGFTTAAICQDQSERSLFHGTKTNGTLIATLQKPEGGPWHTQGRYIAAFWGRDDYFYVRHENRAVRGD